MVIPGRSAPLVASQRGNGQTDDHDTYLRAKRNADILFPTDFALLSRLAAQAAGMPPGSTHGTVLSSGDFIRRSLGPAMLQGAATVDGFTPLVDDFLNTSFLCT